jgi:hypothetical protein
MVFLAAFAVGVYEVGRVSSQKIRVQNAADLAAYSGGQVVADILSEIGWLNQGLAYLDYNAMRYAVDTGVYGTLAELKEHPPGAPTDAHVTDGEGWDPVARYNEVYREAAEWVPRIEHWMDKIVRLQYELAALADQEDDYYWRAGNSPLAGLVSKEVHRAALESLGIDPESGDASRVRVTIFPKLRFWPAQDSYFWLLVDRLSGGWHLEASNDFWLDIQNIGPESWRFELSTGDLFSLVKKEENVYEIETADERIVLTYVEGFGWVAQGSGITDFSVRPGPHGGFILSANGGSGEFRRGPDGRFQEWQGGQWRDLDGTESVEVGGVEIPVYQMSIRIGSATIQLSPLEIWIQNIHIVPSGDRVYVRGQIGPALVHIDDDYAVVNGLNTRNADGLWRRYLSDQVRHRLSVVDTDRWNYEHKTEGSILFPEQNRDRFALVHAVGENMPSGNLPGWVWHETLQPEGWFDPKTGRPRTGTKYHQTRLCWHPQDLDCPLHGGEPYDGGWHLPLVGWVPCPTCWGIDNDGDGRTDVRKYQSQSYDRNDPSYQQVKAVGPLVLSEEFFVYGLNVGVWMKPEESVFSWLSEVFRNPSWGYFSVASVRVGFRDSDTGKYRYRFKDAIERQEWLDNDPANLYEDDWEVSLVPVWNTIRNEDLAVLFDEDDRPLDTGAGYLMRGFSETEWSAEHGGRSVGSPLQGLVDPLGRRFDLTSREMENLLRH